MTNRTAIKNFDPWSRKNYRVTTSKVTVWRGPTAGETENVEKYGQSIPPIVFVIAQVPKQQKMPSTQQQRGRQTGSRNFSKDETIALLHTLLKILPVGTEQWQQVQEIHEVKYPGRDVDALKRKFNMLHRKKAPTGNPNIPFDVKMAKKVKWEIYNKCELGDTEEPFDLQNGYPSRNADADGAIVAPPQPPAASNNGQSRVDVSSSAPSTENQPEPVESNDIVVTDVVEETDSDGALAELASPKAVKRSYYSRADRGEEILKHIATVTKSQNEMFLMMTKTLAAIGEKMSGESSPVNKKSKKNA